MIELKHVSKKYETNNFYSVNDVSFKVEKNTILGLIGNNGAGKSTTMKLLATLYRPNKGSIKIGGFDTVKQPNEVKKLIGFVFETPRLYEQLTGEENILFFARLFGISKDIALARAKDMYKSLNVDFENKRVETYSKGMKQKISFIRALIMDPQVVLMDEPTSGLDIVSRKQIREYTIELKKRGKTLIITSHIAEDIENLCDKVIIMNKGKIYENDTVDNLKLKYDKKNFEQVYVEIQNNIKRMI
ncbi:doxorubicin resistance ATP-binding protein DrrA [Clostridium tepidiprofundi DSM 19306]|uniref:Doxorubicin resistance ATP-binding protein DrrA n=1 Tax=Clostridium tepidiprofundi DSM 19306 TaxID=1121338 RepID=A0A151B5R8_9CLOT|nr:ABC transporter ATP-binding protein [Clostridium tepidiprofundi]KYH35268.1 doxorubicin resistance ATP-binding protein DrrA [Clostridium tepidiprofundi DSM 19306]